MPKKRSNQKKPSPRGVEANATQFELAAPTSRFRIWRVR
jgi:hypothetical protein